MESETRRKIPKWGFGMAPLKLNTESRYCRAVHLFREFLSGKIPAELLSADVVSEVKGLVNRCIRQDQWDWFTVYSRFGEPNPTDLRRIIPFLAQLRRALINSNWVEGERLRQQIIDSYFLTCCYCFLGDELLEGHGHGSGGYIYILSTRDQREILKIGMTTRTVSERVKEINSTTGMLVPLGVRRVFKVTDAAKAEKQVFSALAQFRIRQDREFFQLDFLDAVKIIDNYLKEESLLFQYLGTVKWFSIEKQYGFITSEDGSEVFVHISEVDAAVLGNLDNGFQVQFELGHRPQGKCARNVRLISENRKS